MNDMPTRLPPRGVPTRRVPLWKALEIAEEFYKSQRAHVRNSEYRCTRNGLIGEKYAEIHYQTIVCQKALIDGEYNGRPLAVKTCQVWIHDACNTKRRRRGRFYLRQHQHRVLISKNGFYAFIVRNKEGKVLFSKLVDAKDISMGNRETWQLPWFKIFTDFDYQPESNTKRGEEV